MLCCWLLPQCSLFGPNHRFVDLIVWLFFCVIILYKYIWLSYCFILDVLPHTYTAIDRHTIFENHKADREKKDSFTPIAYNIFGRFCWFFNVFSSIFHSHKAQSITYRVTTATTTTTKLRLQPTKTVDINKIN